MKNSKSVQVAERYFIAMALIAWIAAGFTIFKREIKAALELPRILSLIPDEKKRVIDGQIYDFAQAVVNNTPPNASLIFLYDNPNRLRKALYYLYPRKVEPALAAKREEFDKHDYLAAYLVEGHDAYRALGADDALELLHEGHGGAIFGIKRRGR
ncbi:MAG: hypothetical protein HY886_10250 [Deltaproteobacteria bacterium]|nr:hypothetical protein [Deltaproteobacteria bacterium]